MSRNHPWILSDEDEQWQKDYKEWGYEKRQKERECDWFCLGYESWRDAMAEGPYDDGQSEESFAEKQGYYLDEQALNLASILDVSYDSGREHLEDLIDFLKVAKEQKKELKKNLPKKIEDYRNVEHQEARLESFLHFLNQSSLHLDEVFLESYQKIAGGFYELHL